MNRDESQHRRLAQHLHVQPAQLTTGQMLLTAVFDSLAKGAAGAAVQNLTLMLTYRLKNTSKRNRRRKDVVLSLWTSKPMAYAM